MTAAGIRTEALLPHFLTTVLMPSLPLYLRCSNILSWIQGCVDNVDTVHTMRRAFPLRCVQVLRLI